MKPVQLPIILGSRFLVVAICLSLPMLSLLPSCGSGHYSPSDCASKGSCDDAQSVARQSVKLSWKQKDFASMGAVLYRISAASTKLFEINRNTSGIKVSDEFVTLVLEAQEISDLKPGDCFELRAGTGSGVQSQPSEKSCL